MKPSIGTIVHYVETRPDQAGMEKAAIISGVNHLSPTAINIHVFEPEVIGDEPYAPVKAVWSVPYSESKEIGSWHWPERE